MLVGNPLVSIGVPVYNGEAYLREAVESLLRQTFEDFELIISDNASTDRTEAICREFAERDRRVRYFRNATNLGAAPNYNHVFHLSKGRYFKWAAHDDNHAPTFLEECVKVLEGDPTVVLCFTWVRFIDSAGREIHDWRYDLRVDSKDVTHRFIDLAGSNHIVMEPFGLMRSDVLGRTPLIGNYFSSDRVFLGELAMYGRFEIIPKFLFFHREHADRSMKKFRTVGSLTAWYSTARARTIAFPMWRQLFEHLRSVVRVPLPLDDKARLVREIARIAYWKRWQLVRDVRGGVEQLRGGAPTPGNR